MPKLLRLRHKTYAIISEAVEQGIAYGYNRAHKHTDKPGEEHLKETIREAVMSSLSNVVDLDDR